MALTYSQISAITEKKFIPKMVDNIFDSNVLLKEMKSGESYKKIDGGTSIMQPLEYATNGASGWYSGSDQLSTTDNEVFTAAEYSWKLGYVNVSVTREDELKNSGDPAILDFVKQKVKNAEKTWMDKLGTGLYSAGTDPKSIIGLRSIVAASNTVGGISQSTYSWWAAQLDSSTTTTTIAAMQALYELCSIGSDKPSIIPTTRTLYSKYYALLQPQQRFTDAKKASGGFENLLFNGTPVVVDSYCPASHMFMLNLKYLHLFVHKDEDMRFEPFQKPTNQNVKIAKIYWAGALGSSNNRMHGKLSALTA